MPSPPRRPSATRSVATPRSCGSRSKLTERWSQVIVELDALPEGVVGAMKMRRHRVGATALQAYQVSRQLARYRENAALLPHIDAMRRALRLTRSRSAPPPVTPEVPEAEVPRSS